MYSGSFPPELMAVPVVLLERASIQIQWMFTQVGLSGGAHNLMIIGSNPIASTNMESKPGRSLEPFAKRVV